MEIIYFYLKYNSLNFNEQTFNEISTILKIEKFLETKRINRFKIF